MRLHQLNEVIGHCFALIENGNIIEALNILEEHLPQQQKEIVQYKSRFNSLEKDYNKGKISQEYRDVELNKIRHACLSIVDSLSYNELQTYPIKNKNRKKIDIPDHPFIEGLKPFVELESKIFFGRSKPILQLLGTFLSSSHGIQDRRIIRLTGSSGVGKSSFLQAGVLPRLNGQGWDTTYHICTNIIDCIKKIETFLSTIHIKNKSLLVLDQIETIFLDNKLSEEKKIAAALINCCKYYPNVFVILSYRKEYHLEFGKMFEGDLKKYEIISSSPRLFSLIAFSSCVI